MTEWLPPDQEGRLSPTPLAVGGFLTALAHAMLRLERRPHGNVSASEILDCLNEQIEGMIERESYLTLEDEEDLRSMYSMVLSIVEYRKQRP